MAPAPLTHSWYAASHQIPFHPLLLVLTARRRLSRRARASASRQDPQGALISSLPASSVFIVLPICACLSHKSHKEPMPPASEPAVADRPTFHIMPRAGWLNDPNGLIYHKGYYHVFYQHVPDSCEWNWGLVWGHAVSKDLVHWRHLPHAIQPTPGGPDADGCWSGCCSVDRQSGVPALLYTGVRLRSNPDCGPLPPPDQDLGLNWIESQCAAVPEDPDDPLLVRWRKRDAPILPLPPPGLGLTGWRDPFVLDPAAAPDGRYTLLLGSGFQGKGGALLVYRSDHLLKGWEYVGPLCSGEGAGTPGGSVWECPFLLPLPPAEAAAENGGKGERQWMLEVSPYPAVSPHKPSNPVLYWTGALAHGDGPSCLAFATSKAAGPFRLDLGDLMYAPTVCKAAEGRWLLWGWVQERRKAGAYAYAGCLTVPRTVGLGSEGRVQQEPAPELSQLRIGSGWHASSLQVDPENPVALGGTPSLALDIQLTLHRVEGGEGGAAAGLLFESYNAEDDGNAALLYDWRSNRLEVHFDLAQLLPREIAQDGLEDAEEVLAELASPTHRAVMQAEGAAAEGDAAQAQATCPPAGPAAVGGELSPAPGAQLRLRVLLDHSCLEVFTGDGQVLTTRLYRGALPGSPPVDSGISVLAVGGPALVTDVSVWPLQSCWEDAA